MSEPTFPFPTDAAAEDDAPPASRRRTVLALSGLGVVALGVAGYLVLSGPDEAPLDLGLPTGGAVAAATPSPPAPTAPAPATARSRAGRDPFSGPAGTGAAPAAPAPDAAPGPAAPGTGTPAVTPALPEDDVLPGSGPALGTACRSVAASVSGPAPAAALRTSPRAPHRPCPCCGSPATRPRSSPSTGPWRRSASGRTSGRGSLVLLSLQQGPDQGSWTAVVQRGRATRSTS